MLKQVTPFPHFSSPFLLLLIKEFFGSYSIAGHYRGAINRAYYAMFYAIQALMIKNKVKVSKHTGVIAFFDREFVKPGIIDKEFSKWLHRLFDLRQDADYGDMFEPTEDQCIQAA